MGISVIIPVYNCEEYVEASLDSILNQTFKDIEVICVDDGSQDNSLAKLNEFARKDSRVKVFHKENEGCGDTRNFALPKAIGKYFFFMDADDTLHPEALGNCYELCEEKNLDFLLFKSTTYNESTGKYIDYPYFTMEKLYEGVGDNVFNEESIGDLIFEMSVTATAKLYNREFILATGAKFGEGISFEDNNFFWDILFQAKRILFHNETYYVRRIHSKSIIGSKNRGYFDTFIAFDQVFEKFRKHGRFDKYKTNLYNWKVRLLFFRYSNIHDDYKQEFFEKYKKEISKLADIEGEDEFFEILDSDNRALYNSLMECETAKEFSLSMEVYSLKNKNKKLKEDYDNQKRINKEILNSKSWKVTEPLRGFKRIIK